MQATERERDRETGKRGLEGRGMARNHVIAIGHLVHLRHVILTKMGCQVIMDQCGSKCVQISKDEQICYLAFVKERMIK